jgi:capsular polysaccharide biosynthesis protein
MTEQKEETFEDEIRLDSFVQWVWRGKWLILFLVIVASGVSAILALRQPELHNAAALVEVGRVWGKPLKDIYVTVEIANSQGFIQEVAAKTGVKPGQLARSVQVAAVESGVPHSLYPILIRITARNESADEAVRLAQAVADEIVARHEKSFDDALAPHLERQRQLEGRLKQVQASPADRDFAIKLEDELDDVRANNSSPISTEKTHLAEKVVPGSTIRPDVWRGAATAGVIAVLVGIVAACLIGYYKPARQ